MSTPDTDFAAVAQHAYRLAHGTNALLPDHVLGSVESASHAAEKIDCNFVQDIWLTTSVLRRRGDGAPAIGAWSRYDPKIRIAALARSPERLQLRHAATLTLTIDS